MLRRALSCFALALAVVIPLALTRNGEAAPSALPDAIQGSWVVISWDIQDPLGAFVASTTRTPGVTGTASINGGKLSLTLGVQHTSMHGALVKFDASTSVSIDAGGLTCDDLSVEWGTLYRHGTPYGHAVASRWFTPDGDIYGTDYIVGAAGDATHTRHVLSLQFNENGQEFGVALARE